MIPKRQRKVLLYAIHTTHWYFMLSLTWLSEYCQQVELLSSHCNLMTFKNYNYKEIISEITSKLPTSSLTRTFNIFEYLWFNYIKNFITILKNNLYLKYMKLLFVCSTNLYPTNQTKGPNLTQKLQRVLIIIYIYIKCGKL